MLNVEQNSVFLVHDDFTTAIKIGLVNPEWFQIWKSQSTFRCALKCSNITA